MNTRVSDTYFVFHKAATTAAYMALLILTLRFFRGHLDAPFAAGCTLLSGFWCLLIRLKMQHFMQTYFDIFSRLEVLLPGALGMGLSLIALFSHAAMFTRFAAGAEILCWFGIYEAYIRNKRKFVQEGHGPLPKGAWINPPANIMKGGDLILTSGSVATNLHESVGHAATVIEMNGALYALSSHMDRGTTLEPIGDALAEVRGHYILLEPVRPLDEEKNQELARVAKKMVRDNKLWKNARNKRWQQFITSLPLGQSAKTEMTKWYHCTGFDWFGTLMGRLEPNRWTCIGAAVEVYKRSGIKTNPYGTGLLGFGTTLLDPIMPVRFLNDPAFQLLMEKKKAPPKSPLVFR